MAFFLHKKNVLLTICAPVLLLFLFFSKPKKTSIDYTTNIYTTAHKSDLKLTKTDKISFSDFQQATETDVVIVVNPKRQFQTLLGIGGALTDASAETFSKLPKNAQEKVLESYFDKDKGIGYSLGRTSIHSCDFGSKSFTYIQEGDTKLKTFSIEQDKELRIPFIKKAIKKAGGKLTFYVSPWSPPAFMKTNNNMLLGGKLKKEFYQPWANYYAKFIKAYEKEGIPIWGLTIQNEPMAKQIWESCIYTAEEERDFLKNNLGPTLKNEGLGDKKIVVWDHNRDLLFQRANTIFDDPEASKYAWGSGFHWYEDWKDGKPMFDQVKNVQEAYPDKKLLFTEGCNESYDINRIINEDPKLAERYGKSMINDFNNGTVGWTDWNILLDQNGGPNHVGNLCFSPVHGNTETGKLIFTNSFYYIGHFSKFIRPGAKRISSVSSGNQILSTAFINKDNSIVIVVMNQGNLDQSFSIELAGKTASTNAIAHSIQSIILTPNNHTN
ncbi:glycoside hydrolase family 30 protein [Flavicella marina]|uniref:glycoside hydrolase family 30 protein n=1 Tax=Flavicella marina TaxID=1475951 RepID=UPI001264B2C6|nr:glycoside hydrolase family 30 protein [Flavicella marina]